ncbi:hypothetical protein [Actinokineospora cianjurensis]|uniref:hypothetical protein n=1 Tax=Actinokineospora cianjurensis TaxID=585224 RepID=UPI000EB1F2ED|nr:hypothetical protein [Actinokineospora cianjurensis]
MTAASSGFAAAGMIVPCPASSASMVTLKKNGWPSQARRLVCRAGISAGRGGVHGTVVLSGSV